MKQNKNQKAVEKRQLSDFEHRMTIQLKEDYYVDYALSHSKEQIRHNRQKAILWTVLFFVLGCIAIYKGTMTEEQWSDIYLIAGVVMIVFQLFNLFYNFVMFPVALKRSVLKELKKDPSLLMPMEYAFEPDKIVCFLNGKHRSSVLVDEISGLEETAQTVIIEVKDGRRIIVPKDLLEKAEPVIQKQIQSFRK